MTDDRIQPLSIHISGRSEHTVGFVGCHLDVVPAKPEDWHTNPFELVVSIGRTGLLLV